MLVVLFFYNFGGQKGSKGTTQIKKAHSKGIIFKWRPRQDSNL